VLDRRKSRKIKIGKLAIGGYEKISIQSMLNVSTDYEAVEQAKNLERAGCDIVRIAVPDKNAVILINKLKECLKIPVVADIHFNYNLAIESIFSGADKIRINPGNISKCDIAKIVKVCKLKDIPIRIGINSGSIEKEILQKFGSSTADAMVESAIKNVRIIENLDFYKIVLSLKSSSLLNCVMAYERISEICDYPLHIGVTESGTERSGTIKSAIGIGSLLLKGIGDTIRVSLSADPIKEVETGFLILKSLGLTDGVEVISCPTCGRTKIDVIGIAQSIEEATKNIKKNIKIAVMGCPVNGPGEARDSDFCVTGVDGVGIIFKKGEIVKKVAIENILDELLLLINMWKIF